jgi:carbonic anhydrase
MSTSDMTRIKRLEGKTTDPVIADVFSPYDQTVQANSAPNNASSTVFVVSCIDPRFTSAVEQYLLAQLGPSTTYDLFVLAGAALGVRLLGNGAPIPSCSLVSPGNSWREVLLDHLQVAISLHNVSRIYIIDHLDCAAYGVCGGLDTAAGHFSQFNTIRTVIVGSTFYANGTSAPTPKTAVFTSPNITGLYFNTPVGSTTQLFDYTAGVLPGTSVGTYTFPPTTGAKVLVLGCIDPRFSQILSSFLTNYKEVEFVFDLFITAGASLGVNQSYNLNGTQRATNTTGTAYPQNLLAVGATGRIGPLGHNWGPTFFDHLAVAVQVHKITEVWVFDHLDCGAYKFIKLASGGVPGATDLDPLQHIPEIQKLQGYINSRQSNLAFKGFIIDGRPGLSPAVITKVVDDNNGIVLDKLIYPLSVGDFGSSRIRAPASEIISLRAKASADYVLSRQVQSSPQGFSNQLVRTKLTPVNTLGLAPANRSASTVLETKVGPLKSALLNRNRL